MMFEIKYISWLPGLDKVKLIKAIREDAHLPLAEASRVVDTLLKHQPVSVMVDSLQTAEHLLAESTKLGAIVQSVAAAAPPAQPTCL